MNTEHSRDSLKGQQMIDFALALDDFMDEEVMDHHGKVVGTLACYWQSVNGKLLFLGIKLNGHKGIRVVPGRRSQMDDQQACLKLGFAAQDLESAPQLDCEQEVEASLERAVYDHFGIDEAELQEELRRMSSPS
jgi:hypothetical protein